MIYDETKKCWVWDRLKDPPFKCDILSDENPENMKDAIDNLGSKQHAANSEGGSLGSEQRVELDMVSEAPFYYYIYKIGKFSVLGKGVSYWFVNLMC